MLVRQANAKEKNYERFNKHFDNIKLMLGGSFYTHENVNVSQDNKLNISLKSVYQ